MAGREKKLSSDELEKGTRKLYLADKKFRALPIDKQCSDLLSLYISLFRGKVDKHRYAYGAQTITSLFLVEKNGFHGFTNDQIDDLCRDELFFLRTLKSKDTTPTPLLNILISEFIVVIEGKRDFRQPSLSLLNKIIPEIRELFCKDSEEDYSKKLPKTDVEKVLRNPMYQKSLRELIYSYESLRLSKSFQEYIDEGLNKKPYLANQRARQKNLAHQWLFLLQHYKCKISKESSYPPKRNEVLETIKVYRGNGDSFDKIQGQIQKIFDPDYGIN